MNERLQTALQALRYDSAAHKATVSITLLFGIKAHAQLIGDADVAEECERLINELRATQAAATRPPPAPPETSPPHAD